MAAADQSPDRLWFLAAYRGDNRTDDALDAVRRFRSSPSLIAGDPEGLAALTEGDECHPDDGDRWPGGSRQAFADAQRDIAWMNVVRERDQLRDKLEFRDLDLRSLQDDVDAGRAIERLDKLPEDQRDLAYQLATRDEEIAALEKQLVEAYWPLDDDQGAEDLDPDRHLLGLRPVGDIAVEVDAAGEPAFLFNPVWPSDAHGVLGAAWKVGKTWITLDAAVSVASGTRWLELFPCDNPGPVVMFLGEGGARKMTRRGRAVAHSKGLKWDNLPILLAERVPHLSDAKAIAALAVELHRHPAALVIIDPLYLAAAGAKGSQLYEMATVLEPVQVACQQAGAALMVAHHFNRDTSRKDSERFSGAGPAEWGRVLVSVEKAAEVRDAKTGRTDVTLDLTLDGDEITGGKHRITRSVWADDSTVLGSRLNYVVLPQESPDVLARAKKEEHDALKECMATIVDYFSEHPRVVLSKTKACAELRDYRKALGQDSFRDALVGMALERLHLDHVLDRTDGKRGAINFRAADHGECGNEAP